LVIAKTSSGRSFRALGAYLIHGRDGSEENRAAWSTGRNLGTDDPELAAPLMQATAAQNPRVAYPVYHLTIAFDPGDQVTRENVERVADRALKELGLSEHQALMVAHVHIMVNRVHPDTLRAWERWQDRPIIERVLRAEEQALGLRAVPGRLHQLDDQHRREREGLTPHERAESGPTSKELFAERVKARLAEYRAARTWDDLEARLHSAGLRLERKGQGLVITDGENEIKASRIGRDLSLRRLEERFGISYSEHREQSTQGALGRTERDVTNGTSHGHERVSPAVAEVAEAVRTFERLDALRRERSELSKETSIIRERLHAMDRETQHVARASKALASDFMRVYRDPDAAHARFIDMAQKSGSEAVRTLHETPETFGDLIAVERKRALGLMIETDDSSARQHAVHASRSAGDLVDATTRLNDAVKAHIRDVESRFDRALGLVYQQPDQARVAFEESLRTAGRYGVLELLRERPDRLGALVRTNDTMPGRDVAVARIAAWHLSARAAEVIEAREVIAGATAMTQAKQHSERSTAREHQLDNTIASTPGRNLLENTISRGLRQLEPAELAQLRRVLTNPQRAIAFKIGEKIRDVALGRDNELQM
jgi:hypothetical protein